jgi:hypothetical protein
VGYVARWEKLKKDFETAFQAKRPMLKVKDADAGIVTKSSGITPVLKDIDTALQKKERKTLERAINKLMVVRGPYATLLAKEAGKYSDWNEDLSFQAISTAFRDFMMGLQKLEVDAAADAKKLQETKGAAAGIEFFALEGDVKGTVSSAKKGLAKFATLEKKHSLLKLSDAAVKQAEIYTKTAARTEVKAAKQALLNFKTEAKKCADALAKVSKLETDKDFLKALTSYQNAMQALSAMTRVDAQIRNLTAMEQAG